MNLSINQPVKETPTTEINHPRGKDWTGRGARRGEGQGDRKTTPWREKNTPPSSMRLLFTQWSCRGLWANGNTVEEQWALPAWSGLNICTCSLRVQGSVTRSKNVCYCHLTLLLLGITSDLCLNQAFRASHRFAKRVSETNIRKFKQTYYFSF